MATRPSAPSEIIDPAYFAAQGYPYDEFARLSDEAPVAWCEAPGFEPFWAVTDHADLVWISKQPEIFENAPRQFIAPKSQLGELDLTEVAHQLLNNHDRGSRTRARLTQLATALEFYQMDNSHYPTNDQGLAALLEVPTGPPLPENIFHDA